MILQRIAISLSSALSVGLALALLVGIVPLLRGGDSYELAAKSALLVMVVVYAWVQLRAATRRGKCLLKAGTCLNALVLFPLGVAAALCHVFGGPKIMSREAAALGGIVAVLAIALAAMQVAMLMADGTVKHTIPYGD